MISVLVGLIYGSHHFFISRFLAERGESYYPVTIASNRDEGMMYGPRAKAVFLGQWKAGDVSIAGNEDSPSMLPLFNPVFLGGLGKLLGSLRAAFIASDFLFPPLIFTALYFFAFELSRRRIASSLFAALFVFAPKFFLALPPVTFAALNEFVHSLMPDMRNQLYFGRFEYPKLTFLFFVLAFYFILRSLRRRERYLPYIAGFSVGILFYTYLYDWVYIFAGLGLMSLFFLVQREFDSVKRLSIIAAVASLISIPYWINFIELRNLPHYEDIAARIGVEVGREIRIATAWKTYFRAATLAGLLWFLFRKRSRQVAVYLVSFLLVITMVLNAQVVLGFNPQPDHWHRTQFLSVGLAWFMVGVWLYERYKHFSANRILYRKISFFIIAAFLGSQLLGQYFFSKLTKERYTLSQEYGGSYEWLANNTPKGSVVGSISLATNSELSLHAPNKIFFPNGFNTTISEEEIWQRAMIMSRIAGLTKQEFSDFIKNPGALLYLFHDQYRDRSFDSYFRDAERKLPDSIYQKRIREYEEYLRLPAEKTMRHRLDYFLVGPRELEIGKNPAELFSGIGKVYDKNRIRIYRLQQL